MSLSNAISKSLTAASGVSLGYWKIINLNIDTIQGIFRITVGGWVDSTAHTNYPGNPVEQRSYTLPYASDYDPTAKTFTADTLQESGYDQLIASTADFSGGTKV